MVIYLSAVFCCCYCRFRRCTEITNNSKAMWNVILHRLPACTETDFHRIVTLFTTFQTMLNDVTVDLLSDDPFPKRVKHQL